MTHSIVVSVEIGSALRGEAALLFFKYLTGEWFFFNFPWDVPL